MIRIHQKIYGNNIERKNNNIIDFHANKNSSILFKIKQQITGQTRNDGTKNLFSRWYCSKSSINIYNN